MSIKKFMVFDQENVHEYNIVVEETDKGVEYSLFMSDDCFQRLVTNKFNDKSGLSFYFVSYNYLNDG